MFAEEQAAEQNRDRGHQQRDEQRIGCSRVAISRK